MLRFFFASSIVAVACATGTAQAGGMYIPGVGPTAQARAGAFTAKADDPTALAHNPAGFAKQDGTVIYVGLNLVSMGLEYTRAGAYEATGAGHSYEGEAYPTVTDSSSPPIGVGSMQAVPTIAISTDLGKPSLPIRFGVGIIAPQAYPTRGFPERRDNGAPGPQRYDVMSQEATVALPSIAVAYRPIPQLDIGVRASWGVASLKATTAVWGIRNFGENENVDAIFRIDADDNFVPAFALGVLFRPTASVELGGTYQSAVHIRATGLGSAELGSELGVGTTRDQIIPLSQPQYAMCDPEGSAEALTSCLQVDLPATATLGGRYIFRDAAGREIGDVELDVRFENWGAKCDVSSKIELSGNGQRNCSDHLVLVDGQSEVTSIELSPVLVRHGMKDVLSVRLGGSYQVANDVTVRAGLAHDTKSADVSWTRLDLDSKPRTLFALGASYALGAYRIDVGGGYVYEPSRTVGVCHPPDGPSVGSEGCDGTGAEPYDDRNNPDPGQPLSSFDNQTQSPFNAGSYDSHYLLLSLGVSAVF